MELHPTQQAILKFRKKLMANLASLTCDIPSSNSNWKWVLMTEDEYLLAQCRQHGYDPNSKARVKLGEDAGKIFNRPKVQPAGIFEPPATKSVAQIPNAETKHNKAFSMPDSPSLFASLSLNLVIPNHPHLFTPTTALQMTSPTVPSNKRKQKP